MASNILPLALDQSVQGFQGIIPNITSGFQVLKPLPQLEYSSQSGKTRAVYANLTVVVTKFFPENVWFEQVSRFKIQLEIKPCVSSANDSFVDIRDKSSLELSRPLWPSVWVSRDSTRAAESRLCSLPSRANFTDEIDSTTDRHKQDLSQPCNDKDVKSHSTLPLPSPIGHIDESRFRMEGLCLPFHSWELLSGQESEAFLEKTLHSSSHLCETFSDSYLRSTARLS